MAQEDTKSRILDTAEMLFARNGYHLTSLRSLTSQAGVNLAAVNYHFGSKEALLRAIIERRLLPLNQIRTEKLSAALQTAKQNNQPPKTETLLRAFIEPTLAFRHSGAGAENFVSLIGRSLNEPDQTVRNCFLQLLMPVLDLVREGMQQALPELPESILLVRLQFTFAALGQTMCNSDKPLFNTALATTPTDQQQTEQLLKFSTAGLEAPA